MINKTSLKNQFSHVQILIHYVSSIYLNTSMMSLEI